MPEEKVALITGGGKGIGREIALAFAAEGTKVVLAARTSEALDESVELVQSRGAEALAVPTDISQPDEVAELTERTLDRYGRIDVLVNNSGVAGPTAPIWEIDAEAWTETFAVNVTGTYLCCRAVIPGMLERGEGSVVVIGSMTGKRPLWGRTPYAASKMALVGLVRSLAVEVGSSNVRVNLISPGPVEGERLERVIDAQTKSRGVSRDEVRRELSAGSPLGRLVAQADVAAAVLFLASPASAGITGEDLNVSTGIVMY